MIKSCLIRIKIGDKVSYCENKGEWITVTILDMVLAPNGIYDPKLVCIVYAQKENGNIVSATSDKFNPLDEIEYDEFYPTPHMFELNR